MAVMLAAAPAQAQQPSATVRGAVVSESGEPVPYAVVVLEPGFSQRFADEDGRFAITRVAPGPYRLIARQVGYSPFDSLISITTASPAFRVRLTRLAIRLADLRVTASGNCRTPGSDSAEAVLAAVFEQLRQNAERYRLLSDRYPFRYRMERRLADVRSNAVGRVEIDTLDLTSNARWPYAPGQVVTPDPDARSEGRQFVHLPVLADFADSAFQAAHCFTFKGVERVDGRDALRIEFKPLRRLREPDVEGSAYLDPVTYQIRHTRVSLTQLARAARGVSEWTARTTFREVVPNLVVIQHIDVLTTLTSPPRGGPVLARTEDQNLVSIDFVRPLSTARDTVP